MVEMKTVPSQMPRKIPTFDQPAGRTGHDDVGHQRIDDLLHLRIGREEVFQDVEHLMQLRRVGPEKAEQIPEKEQPGREGEEKLIRHLGGQPHGGIHGGLVDQTPGNSPGEPEVFHLRAEFTLPETNIH